MIFINKCAEPLICSNKEMIKTHNQSYFQHNKLLAYIQNLEEMNKEALEQLCQLNINAMKDKEYYHMILQMINEFKKSQMNENQRNAKAIQDLYQKQLQMNVEHGHAQERIYSLLLDMKTYREKIDQELKQDNKQLSHNISNLKEMLKTTEKSMFLEIARFMNEINQNLQQENQKNSTNINELKKIIKANKKIILQELYDSFKDIDQKLRHDTKDIVKENKQTIMQEVQNLNSLLLESEKKQQGKIEYLFSKLGGLLNQHKSEFLDSHDQIKKLMEIIEHVKEKQEDHYDINLEQLKSLLSSLHTIKDIQIAFEETQKMKFETFADSLSSVEERHIERDQQYLSEVSQLSGKQDEYEKLRLTEHNHTISQLEELAKSHNEALELLQSTQSAVVQLLKNFPPGKAVSSVTVRGQQILLKSFVNYDKQTELISFRNTDDNLVVIDSNQILAISFPSSNTEL